MEDVTQNAPTPVTQTAKSPELPDRKKALVFISHDSRDANLAEALADLLRDVSGGTVKSFRSSDKKGTSGIEFGAHWYKEVMSQLGAATDVVALLTQHSLDRPWILYEAGVASGKLDISVLGVAFGVALDKVSVGPFGQFQNCADDEDSLTKLIMQLIRRNPDASPSEAKVRQEVRDFRQKIPMLLDTKEKETTPSASGAEETNIAKLFEEVKLMVRELPERVDDRVRSILRVVKIGEVHFPKAAPGAYEFYDGKHLGPRKIYVPVTFDSLFTKAPKVNASLQKIDLGDVKANISRISVRAENIRVDGFDLCFETWLDSQIYDAVATWIAVGE
ncbi:MAG TPA: H-type lectin domain-containing protein [Terrimicrobiaceae bacterium]